MAKRCKTKFNKEWIVDGIDVANIWNYTAKEVLKAEAVNHAPEIQYMMGKHIYNVFQEEFDALEKKLEKEYPNEADKEKRLEEWSKEEDKRSLEWFNKAAEQNYAPALYKLYQIYNDDDISEQKPKAFEYFKRALDQYYHEAVEEYISLCRDNELPGDFPKYDQKELIQVVCEREDAVWNEEYMQFEGKDEMENIRMINAHLYKMMFRMYDQVKELKTQLDSFIKQGKTYYNNYEIDCGIGFYPATEYKLEDGTVFEGADCEWELISTYKKKLPEKMKALSLWQNYHFGPFEDLTHDYVCKAIYSFICPKKEKDDGKHTNYKVPFEVLKQCKPEDFKISINLWFGKNLQHSNITYEDWEDWRQSNYTKKLHLPSFWELPFLRPLRILSQDKALLRVELESGDIGNQIIKDFDAIKGDMDSIFSAFRVDMRLTYCYQRPFGIKTKTDSLVENEIQLMCGLNGISSANLDNHSNEKDIPQWCDPPLFMQSPYNKHYMCFANHGIWDHCSLRHDQIMKLKPGHFGWICEMTFDEYEE